MKTVSGIYVFMRDFRAFLPKHDIRGFIPNKFLTLVFQTRTIDGTVRRTQPHLLNRQNRKRPNMRASTPICRIIGGSRMNPTNASSGNYNQFGLPPTTTGDSSSLLQSQTAYTGVVPQDGVTKAYLYLPELLCTTSKNAATSGSPYREDSVSLH
jgi:hypothetical protein